MCYIVLDKCGGDYLVEALCIKFDNQGNERADQGKPTNRGCSSERTDE